MRNMLSIGRKWNSLHLFTCSQNPATIKASSSAYVIKIKVSDKHMKGTGEVKLNENSKAFQ